MFAVPCFVIAMCVSAQDSTLTWSKVDLQDMYMVYLNEEGYKPEVDEDGDVRFKREGKTYFINVDAADTASFRLVLANIWPIESEEERSDAYIAMDHCNALAKVAKAYMVRDDVWVAIETFIARPQDFKVIFQRSFDALDHGVGLFARRMRAERSPDLRIQETPPPGIR
jgi:hypothetical protein